jgi:hypothetical protein
VSSGEYLSARPEHDGARCGQEIFHQKNILDREIFYHKGTSVFVNKNKSHRKNICDRRPVLSTKEKTPIREFFILY